MDQWDFIEASAAELGVTPEAFRKWRVRGVPHVARLDIVKRASRLGFDLDEGAFERPPGSKRAAKHAEAA